MPMCQLLILAFLLAGTCASSSPLSKLLTSSKACLSDLTWTQL